MAIDFVNYTILTLNGLEEKFNYFYKKTLKILKLKDIYFLEVDIITSKKIHLINKKYRNRNSVTDVISFAFNDDKKNDLGLKDFNFLGCIFINYQRAKTQAKKYGNTFNREICFLFIHGLLHLLGYDHMNKQDEEIMTNLQKKILEGENL